MQKLLIGLFFCCAVALVGTSGTPAATLYDLVRMTSPTTGATNVVALGSALPGFLSFSGAGVPDGTLVSIAISDTGGSPAQGLTGRGVYSAGAQTVTVTTIFASTNANAMIPLSGSEQIAISALAEDINQISPAAGTRIITSSAATTLLTSDQFVGFNRTVSPAQTAVALPVVPIGQSVTIADLSGNADQYNIIVSLPGLQTFPGGLATFTFNQQKLTATFTYYGNNLWGASAAQFPDQLTAAGTAGGTANALALTVPNYNVDMPLVAIRFIANAVNTSNVTVAINSRAALPLVKQTLNGVAPLTGTELQAGQIYVIAYDGHSEYQIVSPTPSVVGANLNANSYVGNATSAPGQPLALSWPPCPDQSGQHLNYVNGSGVACGSSYVPTLLSNVQSSSYAIQNSDCGKVVVETGILQLVTLPSGSGFTNNCVLTVLNGNTLHANEISGFPVPAPVAACGNTCIWPGQALELFNDGGTWVLLRTQSERYSTENVTLYISTVGNDDNDGLSTSTPLATVAQCIALLTHYFDTHFTNPTCQLADGTYTLSIFLSGQGTFASDGIVINGDAATPSNVVCSNCTIGTRDTGILFVQNMELACPGANTVNASQFSTIDVLNVIEGTCTSHNPFEAQDGGHVDFDGGNEIAGNAASFFYTLGAGSQIEAESQTFTCIGSPNISDFVDAVELSQVEATGLAFVNCSGNAGARYVGAYNAGIDTGGGGANYFPGNSAGSVSNGAYYE